MSLSFAGTDIGGLVGQGHALPVEKVTFRHAANHCLVQACDNRLMTHLAGHGPAPPWRRSYNWEN
jgi:hypothetical protein